MKVKDILRHTQVNTTFSIFDGATLVYYGKIENKINIEENIITFNLEDSITDLIVTGVRCMGKDHLAIYCNL